MPAIDLGTELEELAARVVDAAPCALEMPAGTGKTHLLAAAVLVAAKRKQRSLILTHTNAGVDALRKRLKTFGVDMTSFRIETITSWAFTLVRSYPSLARLSVPELPDWTDSASYIEAASRVLQYKAVRRMLQVSFDFLFVDEYQDCNVKQHQFLGAISDAVPNSVVFGDRLQGIFGFGGEILVDWDGDVFPRFPLLSVEHKAHRWADVNPRLGAWLLGLRGSLKHGQTLDLSTVNVPGVRWVCSTDSDLADVAFSFRDYSETVLILDKWAGDVARHASRLGGSYSVMEDIRGRFMLDELAKLPSDGSPRIAFWLAAFAKQCIVGLSGIDSSVLQKLGRNEPIGHLRRNGIEGVVEDLEQLRIDPSYGAAIRVARRMTMTAGLKVYRWEAWTDVLGAIEGSLVSDSGPLEEFGRIRDRLRRAGRRAHSRIASRTLLVKGLEYDHVIIADATKLVDPRNLYVALTRARKSVTILGPSPIVELVDDA
ncbi:UvrD-helicase domain-containing protein [Curtobacterium sp. GD1]|uniref:UvrD-helicase domain-containing protein n=1 Tax=Curtobacterium sp. GD1 TaxID=2810612 RepID=UPI001E44EFAA|nr:UvrD-helicase domain-containing protein [Curtobacterium sp. GD1]MCC8907760.1 UvrD-helicase domain-containing protein [Curtobacterium sp. GD1]